MLEDQPYLSSKSYGRAMLLIHQPWLENDPLIGEGRWTELFEEFLETDHCPSSVKIAYEQVRQSSEKIKLVHILN